MTEPPACRNAFAPLAHRDAATNRADGLQHSTAVHLDISVRTTFGELPGVGQHQQYDGFSRYTPQGTLRASPFVVATHPFAEGQLRVPHQWHQMLTVRRRNSRRGVVAWDHHEHRVQYLGSIPVGAESYAKPESTEGTMAVEVRRGCGTGDRAGEGWCRCNGRCGMWMPRQGDVDGLR